MSETSSALIYDGKEMLKAYLIGRKRETNRTSAVWAYGEEYVDHMEERCFSCYGRQ